MSLGGRSSGGGDNRGGGGGGGRGSSLLLLLGLLDASLLGTSDALIVLPLTNHGKEEAGYDLSRIE